MYRQSPSRNQRSKSIKVKYVLQICLLIAVCFWLIYQVKHSHDKKKEFDESDAKASLQKVNSDELIKLGRKDIRPREDQTNEKHDEPVEEEETTEEEENKPEEEENKPEEDEPEDKNVERKEDDETDDHEQEKSDGEVEREEDLENENETQEADSEDGHDRKEKESSSDDADRERDDKSTHEARDENYKADDASSAVTHDTQTGASENENERVENSNESTENVLEADNKENNTDETNKGENRKDLEVEGDEIAIGDHRSTVTTSETNVDVLDNSENGSPPNNTVTEGSNDDLTSNSSVEVTIENHDLSEQSNNSILIGTNRFDSNSTGSGETENAELHSEDSSNSSNNNTESSALEKTFETVDAGNNTESSSEKNDEIESEKSDTREDGTYETSESTVTENPEEIQHDAIDTSDTSDTLEEKHVRTDLDTLPEIQIEGTNSEDDAAE